MRNLLEEFHGNHGIRLPTILGVREHVFTGRYIYIVYFKSVIKRVTFLFYHFHVICAVFLP